MIKGILDRFRSYPELRTGIVNLKSGTAFRGVVWGVRGGWGRPGWLVLRNVEVVEVRGQAVERKVVDGEVVVPLNEVDFVQVL